MTLENAKIERAQSRTEMESAKPGSKKWLEAEGNLNFWQGKVAMLEAMKNN